MPLPFFSSCGKSTPCGPSFNSLAMLAAVFSLLSTDSSSKTLQAQNITFFFSAGDLSENPDRFGNTHSVGPAEAIDPRPFGNEALLDVFFDEDDKWLLYQVAGNTMLVSHSPSGFEDAPELTMDIAVAIGGTYEVILNFLDSRENPGDGTLQAALGENDLVEYSELNATPATGGTSPGYPQFDGTTQGTMWWQTVSLGEVEVDDGGHIRVRIDDTENGFADDWVTSTWQGITLRVIELGGAIAEIQVSPGAFDWVTDVSGNQFRTGPVDTTLGQEEWLTVNANSANDGKWNIREGLGAYGPILESFPASGEDAPELKTSVIFAKGGTYDVFLNLGDTGAADPDENLSTQTPLLFSLPGEEWIRWHANDGVFKGTPGYNNYEMQVGQVKVEDGEQLDFGMDDVQDGTATRSVYLGMRFERQPEVVITEFNVSPGVIEPTEDIFGNSFYTWAEDASVYAAQEDWLTVNANSASDGKWNVREGLGPYGPIFESFPLSGEDAPTLKTLVTFAKAGRYDVVLSLGDTGASDPAENLTTQTPLMFALPGQSWVRWHANDGVFSGTPGYNNYEMAVGQVAVMQAGESMDFLIDDVQDETATRSVYLGMRLVYLGEVEQGATKTELKIALENGDQPNLLLEWQAAAQGAYQLEVSEDLQTWELLEEGVHDLDASIRLPFDLDAEQRFYRLR